eukprot:TCONS_00046675-protein
MDAREIVLPPNTQSSAAGNAHRPWPAKHHPGPHEGQVPTPPGSLPATSKPPMPNPPAGAVPTHTAHWNSGGHPSREGALSTSDRAADIMLLKQEASSRFQPYRHHHATPPAGPPTSTTGGHNVRPKKFPKFTAKDIERYLYGRQEMKIVNIEETKEKQIACGPKENGVKSEDKNKPAKWCDLCQEIRFGECPEHGPLTAQRDSINLQGPKSYAISTFPDEVGLCVSTIPMSGYGVFARLFIPLGTWIGPYEGKKISVDDGMKMVGKGEGNFLWEIHENGRLSAFLDASDEKTSSWMRFIQCARHKGEQNLFVFQYYGSIYYRAFKDITVGEELLAWYDDKYPQYCGIPYEMSDFASYLTETGQIPPGDGPPKGGNPAEFDRHHPPLSEEGYPPHNPHHYHHPRSGGSHLIQGPGSKPKTGGDKHRSEVSKHPPKHGPKEYPHALAQPPTLSQAPHGTDSRFITSASGKAPPKQHPHMSLARFSPRPGSASFRRTEHAHNSMLRSMSEDDLRHKPPKHHEGIRPHGARHRPHFDREHHEHHPPEHMIPHGAPSHFMVHQGGPHGTPQPHISPVTNYSPLRPVMSITPLDRSKGSRDDLNKLQGAGGHPEKGFYEKHSSEYILEHERMLHLHDQALHGERGPKNGRMPHYGGQDSGSEMRHIGRKFTHKQSFDSPMVGEGVEKHPHYPPNTCTRCQITIPDPREFHEHMMSHRERDGNPSMSERPPFWCGLCARSFSSATSLKNHMKMHDKGHPPPGSPVPVAKNMPTGVPLPPGGSTLSSGGMPPPQGGELPPVHATKDLNATKPTDCMKCGKTFTKSSDFAKHLATPGECVPHT